MTTLLNSMFPEACVGCGSVADETLSVPLCTDCLGELSRLHSHNVCVRCGVQLPQFLTICHRCARVEYAFEWCQAAALYTGVAEEVLQAYKFGNVRRLARIMAEAMLASASAYRGMELCSDHVIVPVPSSRRSIRRRGFHSALELARAVCASGGGTVWNPLRQTDGISQKKLDYEGRFHHAAESITYTDRRSPVTATNSGSRTVVLVDDVFTTGATLSHCASLLRQHGIRRVFGLVFVMEP